MCAGWAVAGHGTPTACAGSNSSSDEAEEGICPGAVFEEQLACSSHTAKSTAHRDPDMPIQAEGVQHTQPQLQASSPPVRQQHSSSGRPAVSGQLVSPAVRAELACKLVLKERQRLGACCKRLLDVGRLHWLVQKGFQVHPDLSRTPS